MAGFYKVLCHALPFGVLQPVAKQSSLFYHYTSTMSSPRKEVLPSALMISQNIDLVAGDFNGAAWRCRSLDNLSSIDGAFADCALPTPPGPTPLWGRGSIPNDWSNQWNHQAHCNGNIRLKERPASSGNGAPRSIERPLVLIMSAQPLPLPGSCAFPCSSSRSDLMRFDVLARLPQVRQHVQFFS